MESNSDHFSKNSIINILITKLSTRIIVIILALVIILLASIIGFAVYKKIPISIWILKIGVSEGEPIEALEATIRRLQEDLERCSTSFESHKENSVSTSDLRTSISETYFNTSLSKNQLLIKIRELFKFMKDIKEDETHYSYKLFKIEKLMSRYGNPIDTNIIGEKKEEAYKIIQDLLRGIHYYRGLINGDRQSTYEAVRKFQKEFNNKSREEIFNPDDFGIFGYRTLEAVRSNYRLKKD